MDIKPNFVGHEGAFEVWDIKWEPGVRCRYIIQPDRWKTLYRKYIVNHNQDEFERELNRLAEYHLCFESTKESSMNLVNRAVRMVEQGLSPRKALARVLESRAKIVEGASVSKRAGTKTDSYGYSGEVPTTVWDVYITPKTGGEIVYFEDFGGEGPALQAFFNSSDDIGLDDGTQYMAASDNISASQADTYAKSLVAAINAAVSKSDEKSYDKVLQLPSPWKRF